jgi:Zn-finger nucleic acid-binding protein
MLMCPKCRSATLATFSGGGRAEHPARCSQCRGVWVPRRASVFESLEDGGPDSAGASSDAHAGLCPKGHGLLRRARLDGDLGFALDRCSTCGGTWFDAGEWHEIASRQLLESLDDLWDPVKQRQAREIKGLDRWRSEMLATLGAKTMGELEDLARVLATHPDGVQALAFLQEAVRLRRRGGSR